MREALLGAWVPGVEAEPLPADLENPSFDIGPALDTRADATAELRALLYEVTQYLDDHVPPLFVSDSVVALVERPRVDTAIHVLEWARAQRRLATDVPIAQLLFHALAQAEHGRDPEPDREGPARREAAELRRAPRRGLRHRRPRALPRRARPARGSRRSRVGADAADEAGRHAEARGHDTRPAPPVAPRAAAAARPAGEGGRGRQGAPARRVAGARAGRQRGAQRRRARRPPEAAACRRSPLRRRPDLPPASARSWPTGR